MKKDKGWQECNKVCDINRGVDPPKDATLFMEVSGEYGFHTIPQIAELGFYHSEHGINGFKVVYRGHEGNPDGSVQEVKPENG